MDGNIDFPVTSSYTKENIRKVQQVLLVMAEKITNVLDRHNIKYFITFGTLLGAVRHHGFVPWDDDFDLFLFDEEYDEAMEYLRKELPSWLIVHDDKNDEIYWPYWSRVRDLNTETHAELWPDDNLFKYRGINVDLYRLKKAKKTEARLHVLRENREYFLRKRTKGLIDDELCSRKLSQVDVELANEMKNIHKEDGTDEELYYFVMITKYIKPEEIFPLRRYEFEGHKFWGPCNSDSLLKQAYGEYMSLPVYEKRKPHYSEVIYKDAMFEYR